MEKNVKEPASVTSLDEILKKSLFFSTEINRLQQSVDDLKNSKGVLSKKENALADELIGLAQSLYQFQEDIISQLQTVTQHINNTTTPAEAIIDKQAIKSESGDNQSFEVIRHPAESNSGEKKSSLPQPNAEEVYLFDL
ncbi:MAG: hypothetical protein JW795_06045 [Chitinivibrionales bacterium]|nr:hypothetical protein [Chitinivibrionales bacterium]